MNRASLHARLDRVREGLATTTPLTARSHETSPDEARELAAEVARTFREALTYYRDHYKLTAEEARARAAECPDHCVEHALTVPPDEVSWSDLDAIAHRDHAQALVRWEQVKEAARGDLRCGLRAARALEGFEGRLWDRAGFLAVRSELITA